MCSKSLKKINRYLLKLLRDNGFDRKFFGIDKEVYTELMELAGNLDGKEEEIPYAKILKNTSVYNMLPDIKLIMYLFEKEISKIKSS